MKTALLLIGDGRHDYRERTLASAADNLPPMDYGVEIDDSDHKLGFAGAIQAGWEQILETDAEYVFHLEADFIFNYRVPLESMVNLLYRHPRLAQVALKRQPWNEAECNAGGICELNPDNFTNHVYWCENSVCFTTNPCVYSTEICKQGWPQVKNSEGIFTHQLLRQGRTFAYWGLKFDPPSVTHIGNERMGTGY